MDVGGERRLKEKEGRKGCSEEGAERYGTSEEAVEGKGLSGGVRSYPPIPEAQAECTSLRLSASDLEPPLSTYYRLVSSARWRGS
ncbi:hypothetical protein NPIL_381331 [Nephila pilipes]|uniref:Uncharacterized protein n=1 Tax=Nephila pilipes TaxID=299642 RepID=A0A8X6UIZ5_NEPPI|nr:hypothetical protein NPIL_381331 [Nephila pilipes]